MSWTLLAGLVIGLSVALIATIARRHDLAEMDKEHKDENGYVWNSAACLSCHPNGKE